jgi:hypothetical protein
MKKRKISLAEAHSDLIKEWHPTKNGSLTPFDLSPQSNKIVWWQCLKNSSHEWPSSPSHRIRGKGRGCHYCSHQKVSIETCLATVNPDLTKEWHPTKNEPLTPYDVFPNAKKKVWWLGSKCGHEWEAALSSRHSKGTNCLVCSGTIVTNVNCFANMYPELAKQWHPTKNGGLLPTQVTSAARIKVWWQCPTNKTHSWDTFIYNRTKKNNPSGCPYCKGLKASTENCLAVINPKLALEWHPTKNGDLTPSDITPYSNRKVWWKCLDNENHDWRAQIGSRSGNINSLNGSGCPKCSGSIPSLEYCLAAINPEAAAFWHPTRNGVLTPYDVLPNSKQKVWWYCDKGVQCVHEWDSTISNLNRTPACRYCSNTKPCLDNCLATVNPKLAEEWHPTKNGDLTPWDVFPVTARTVWWQCKNNNDHEWQAKISNRKNNRGCPTCKMEQQSSFYEQAIFYYVKQIFPSSENKIALELNESEKTLWTKNKIELDIYIPELQIGIEYDGGFHIKDQIYERDKKKSKIMHLKKITLIRIRNDKLREWNEDIVFLHDENKDNTFNACIVNLLSFINDKYYPDNQFEEIIRIQRDIDIKKHTLEIFSQYIQLQKENSLAITHPDLVREWHPIKNGNITPYHVTQGSGMKVWWQCLSNNTHEWEAAIYSRTSGNGCNSCRIEKERSGRKRNQKAEVLSLDASDRELKRVRGITYKP